MIEKKAEIDRTISFLNIASRNAQVLLDQALKPLNLNTSNYYFILKIAGHADLTQDQLFNLIHLDHSNVTRRLDQLMQLGMVTKIRSTKDGRQWRLSLTDSGLALVPQIEQAVTAVNAKFFHRLTPVQVQTLTVLLTHLQEE
ncbi:MarR family winged helix-turn-helix transcriptional regulator [Secundilactobacillus collinoides]|uniref:HTH marR-type domain-containing protein n=1 Tax=Secundilactobacillus collinoides TaxID=33960 RepID=A0A161UP25_SECCO|nr:MarR family transcriptional regulator [Secundilactobacillus collinoides]KZL43222.1 hypothetical protein TY91_01040 [Secundilactobacillus collinoides]